MLHYQYTTTNTLKRVDPVSQVLEMRIEECELNSRSLSKIHVFNPIWPRVLQLTISHERNLLHTHAQLILKIAKIDKNSPF